MYLKHFLDVLYVSLNVLYAFISLINEGVIILQPAFQNKPLLLLLLLLHQRLMLISINSRLEIQRCRDCCLLGLFGQTGCLLAFGYLQCRLQVLEGCLHRVTTVGQTMLMCVWAHVSRHHVGGQWHEPQLRRTATALMKNDTVPDNIQVCACMRRHVALHLCQVIQAWHAAMQNVAPRELYIHSRHKTPNACSAACHDLLRTKAHLKAADKPASLLCLLLSMKRVQPLTDGFC